MTVSRDLLNETLRLRVPYNTPFEQRVRDLFENTYTVIDGLETAVNGNPYNQAATFDDLPAAADNNAVIYVVQQTTGIIGFRRLAGLYRSDGANWNYLGLYGRNAVEITNVPAGSLVSTDVQAAINELDSDLQATAVSLGTKEDAGTASTIVGIHEAAVNPHPQYLLTADALFAPSVHPHIIADVTGLQTALDGKQPLATVLTNTTAAFTTAQETKLAGIATGATANSTDASLRDRGTHTGAQAISTVTGLQTALDGKQATLVSGTNIKTINGSSVLGAGDIVVSAEAGSVVASRIYRNSNQSIPSGATWTDIVWTTADYEQGGEFWSSGAVVTVPEDSYYKVMAEVTFDGAGFLTDVTAEMQLLADGVDIASDINTVPAGAVDALHAMTQRFFTAGTQLRVQAHHSMGTAVNVITQGDHAPDIALHKIGGAQGEPGPAAVATAPYDYWYEFWAGVTSGTASDRWNGAAISGGSNTTALPAVALVHKFNHGVFIRSGTTANGGWRYQTTSAAGDVFGQVSHKFRCAFLWRTSFTGRTVRIGYHDTPTSADATDGAYFEILDSTCSAKTASNSTRTTNATTLTLALDIPYLFDIEVNAAGTEARFRVYNGDTKALLLDVTNTTNIPTGTARSFGSGIVATELTTTASDIGIFYMLGEGTVEGFVRARG